MARIAVNALGNLKGGTWRNLLVLLDQWHETGELDRHRFTLYASQGVLEGIPAKWTNHIGVRACLNPGASLSRRFFVEQYSLPRWMACDGIEICFCPTNIVPLRCTIPSVLVFQQAAPFDKAISLSMVGFKAWTVFLVLRRLMMAGACRARRVVFLSRHFRDVFRQHCPIPLEKTHVIPRCADSHRTMSPQAVPFSTEIPEEFVLCISRLHPYKCILEVIQGYVLFRRRAPSRARLLLAGDSPFPGYRRRIDKAIAASGFAEDIRLMGFCNADQMAFLQERAFCQVFASLCENCPTTVIEALAQGMPLVCSHMSSMPEVAGDAAVYCDPRSPEDIASGISRIYGNPAFQEQLRKKAITRFTELPDARTTAKDTLSVILDSR